MAIKKTGLYSSLWSSCDELRGSMDASQYKDFKLTMLFMKYVSDKYKGDPYGMIVVPEGASYYVSSSGDKNKCVVPSVQLGASKSYSVGRIAYAFIGELQRKP